MRSLVKIKKDWDLMVLCGMMLYGPVWQMVASLHEGDLEKAAAYFLALCATVTLGLAMLLIRRQSELIDEFAETVREERAYNARLMNAVMENRLSDTIEQLSRAEQQATWN